ncbi:MAG: 23S rRNA (adenine2503-C2)-methyltransferase [Rhodothermales bacterium]|jgi:23S rRNA (adenine2503-C2)-methyltransferase
MDSARIQTIVETLELPRFRARQLADAFFGQHADSFNAVSTFSKDLRARLSAEFAAMTVEQSAVFVSADGRAHKALLKLHDGKVVESVLLNPKPGLWSCCISSQVGCALKCTFCATGLLGLARNLTSEEISDQVLFWRQYIRRNEMDCELRNVVYMGMGEPLQNHREVFASLDELGNSESFNIGSRHLSVSTSGLTRQMRMFTDRFPQVNLAVSLHAANDSLRESMMPINKANPLAELADAMRYHMAQTRRKIFVEYILLAEENDADSHAVELADFLRSVGELHLLHVNLIVYNPTDTEHVQSPRDRAHAFKALLQNQGVPCTIRRNLGRDIDGACGQLALKAPELAS